MKKIITLLILIIGLTNATEYRLIHLKKGGKLNVRHSPVVNSETWVGKIPWYASGIKIKHCKYNSSGKEWCYISYPMGARHLEGWVSRYYLAPISGDVTSKVYIKNFLRNYYKADEEDFLDKLNDFYHFPMQQYLYKKNVNHIQLRTKKVSFYKRWSRRKYRMTYMKILKRRENYIDIQTSVRWRFSNRSEYESGRDIEKLRLVLDGNQFKVLAMKRLRRSVDPKIIEEEIIPDNNETNGTVKNITTTDELYYIKVGSFFSAPNSEYLSNIALYGFKYIIKKVTKDNAEIQRVYIGPYSTTTEAIDALERVKSNINENAYIRSF